MLYCLLIQYMWSVLVQLYFVNEGVTVQLRLTAPPSGERRQSCITSGCVRGSQGESSWLQTSSSTRPGCATIWQETFAFLWTVWIIYLCVCFSFDISSFHCMSGRGGGGGILLTGMNAGCRKERPSPRSRIRIRCLFARARSQMSILLFCFHTPPDVFNWAERSVATSCSTRQHQQILWRNICYCPSEKTCIHAEI